MQVDALPWRCVVTPVVGVGAVVGAVMVWAIGMSLWDRRKQPAESVYAAEERRILDDDGPFDWPAHDFDQPEYCGCRDCHSDGIEQFSKDAVNTAFADMVGADPLLAGLARVRVRRWTR
jgi:hypothetical protein